MLAFSKRVAQRFSSIDTLPVSSYLKSSLQEFGIRRLTSIQSEVFAPILAGKSTLAVAKTGTGKTLAYLVPLLARLENERFGSFSTLIVVPTRELCQQIGSVVVRMNPSLHVCLAFGKPTPAFDTLLKQGPHLVVATAGRAASLVRRGDIDLKKVKILVVDELDSLLTEEYRRSLDFVGQVSPQTAQVIGVGATFTESLGKILKGFPAFAPVVENAFVATPKQGGGPVEHFLMKTSNRVSTLVALLATRKFQKCIVFAKNTAEIVSVSHHPNLTDKVLLLHGDLGDRDVVLNKFRTASTNAILLSTDVASRGIDVPEVDLVVHYSLPIDGISYIHRAGRTGRAGKAGVSIALYSSSDEHIYKSFETVGKFKFEKLASISPNDQRTIMINSLIEEARKQLVGEKLLYASRQLISKEPKVAEQVAKTCIQALLGIPIDKQLHSRSVLSGKVGFTPLLFVDPEKTQSQSELENFLSANNIKYGAIALSESGYIADIAQEQVKTIREIKATEVEVLETLPKLITRSKGSKSSSLPWRRIRKRPSNSLG